MRVSGLGVSLAGALVLGVVSTFGDFLWETVVPGHRMIYGLLHGMLLLACVGLWLGVPARRPAAGACGGIAIGLLSAGGFYALAPLMGYAAMFPMWMLLWLLFAWLHVRVLARRTLGEAVWRGLLAGISSGLAFYAISGIWLTPSPGGPNYPWHLVAWTLAFLPGFLALMAARATPLSPPAHL